MEDGLRQCRNCNTQNLLNATICKSCGLNLSEFETLSENFGNYQQRYQEQYQSQISAEISEQATQTNIANKAQFRSLMTMTVLVSLVLLGVVIAFAFWRGQQIRQYQAELAADYASANECLRNENFTCAVDSFASVLAREPNYEDAAALLQQAQLSWIDELVAQGQFDTAIETSTSLFTSDPTNAPLRTVHETVLLAYAAQKTSLSLWAEAVELLDEATELNKTNVQTRADLEKAYKFWYSALDGKTRPILKPTIRRAYYDRFPDGDIEDLSLYEPPSG